CQRQLLRQHLIPEQRLSLRLPHRLAGDGLGRLNRPEGGRRGKRDRNRRPAHLFRDRLAGAAMTRRRGLTYLEVLAAAVLVAIAAAAALSTWQLTSRAPANKRLTEMGSLLAVREI